MNTAKQVRKLLDDLKADFPRRKKAIEEKMKEYGLDKSVELVIEPPEVVTTIPTFHAKRPRQASPMLQARFDYAGTLIYAGEEWLAASAMPRQMKKKDVKSYHKSLRENWEGSAPMLFTDDQLTVFAVTDGVPDNLTYLVWSKDGDEPEVWRYAGLNSNRFKNLAEYLSWFSQSE